MQNNQSKYRVVYAGGVGRLHKTYFKSYDVALAYFSRASSRLHPYGYAEIQELDGGAYLTVDQAFGGAL